MPHGGEREQQFSCDLHGDGSDSKPSARVYPSSNSWYCFACAKKRDAINTLIEREGIRFGEACTKLEKQYGLPPLPWTDEDRNKFEGLQKFTSSSFSDIQKRLQALIQAQQIERRLTLRQYLSVWEVYDMVSYKVEKGSLDEEKGIGALETLRVKVLEYIKGNPQ